MLPLWSLDSAIGTFNAKVELFHCSVNSCDEDDAKDSYATVLGGYLSYRSKPLWGFGVEIKHYYTHPIFSSQNPDKTSLTTSSGEGISPLAQLYLYYQNSFMEIRAGKQQLNTPLINNDNTRLIPYSYDAITAKIHLKESTTLSLGHVRRFRANNSESYTQNSSSGYAKDGVSFIGLNTRLGAVDHQWYYYHANGLYNALHMEVKSKIAYRASTNLLYGLQAIYTFANGDGVNIDNRSNGGDDVKLLSTKVGFERGGFETDFSLSYNFGNDGMSRGYGGLASLYTTLMITSGKKQGKPFAKSLKFKYTYDASTRKDAHTTALYLSNITYDDPTFHDTNALYIGHTFRFRPREYIQVRFEKQWVENANDKSCFRVISAYNF